MYKQYAEHACDVLHNRWPVVRIVSCSSVPVVWCAVRSSPSMAHHGENPGFQYFRTISTQYSL